MNIKVVVLICVIAWLAYAAPAVSFQSHYISLGTQDTSVAIVADSAGNIFIVSKIDLAGSSSIRVTKTDPSGKVTAVMNFGQDAYPIGAAVDSQGNVYVVGSLTAKLDNALTSILATSNIGGSAIATDATGNVYVAGALGANLTFTPGYIVVAELSPDLSTVVHTTMFGSSSADCNPISANCRRANGPGLPASATATAIALDSAGSVVVAGYTNGTPAPLDSEPYDYGFVVKFSGDFSTFLGEAVFNPIGADTGQTYFRAAAVDSQGNVVVVGNAYADVTLPGSRLQPNSPYPDGGGIVLKYDSDLKNLLWGAYFGASNNGDASVQGVAVDSQGTIWITGVSQENYLPHSTSSSIANLPFVAELSPDGNEILNLVSSQFGGAALAITLNDRVAVLGSTDSFVLSGSPDQPALLMVANSANNQSSGTIAPIELISLFGTGIGPASPTGGEVVDGAFTDSLGGYQVLFNGMPAPLLYAGPNQINVVSPAAIANQQAVDIVVVGPSSTTMFPPVFVGPVRPQIFSEQRPHVDENPAFPVLYTYAIAYNQDGSPNLATNPAPEGSIVTIWATGTGLVGDPLPDGSIATSAAALNSAVVMVGTEVLYAGQAPGAVQGLTQINFRVPSRPFVFGPVLSGVNFQQGGSTTRVAEFEITVNN